MRTLKKCSWYVPGTVVGATPILHLAALASIVRFVHLRVGSGGTVEWRRGRSSGCSTKFMGACGGKNLNIEIHIYFEYV